MLEEARKIFSHDHFAVQCMGAVIDAVDKNYAKCSLILDKRHYNAVGQVMGGVAFTLADLVFAVASNFRGSPTVTLTSQISYLNAVKGTVLYGESKLIKDGKRTCFYEVSITDNLGTQVADVMITGAHI